jgi:Pectate lyase superfamily protein
MALKTLPQVNDLNWGAPLNAHIGQLQSSVDGGINKFEQFSQRPTNLTADDQGKTYLYTQTGNIHQWTGATWKVLNESVINVKDYGAVGDGVVDDTGAIQAGIDYAAALTFTTNKNKVFVPQGKYKITTTLNLTTYGAGTSRHNLNIQFENRSSEYEFGTLLIGETGEKPVIETTGSDGITIINCGIKAGINNKSKIGILQARPDGGGWCGEHKYENLYISLGSDPSANGGIGTIGFINIAGEESDYCHVEIWANTCYVSSASKSFRSSKTSGGYTGFNNYTINSSFGIPIHTNGSNTVHTFSGYSRLISYDYFSPAVLIMGNSDFDLGHTFIQKRLAPGASIASSDYTYAIECWACYGFKHYGNIEGCGQYMLLRRDLAQADIRIRLQNANISNNPLLYCWNDGGAYIILNSNINIYSEGGQSLLGYNQLGGATAHAIKSSIIWDSRIYLPTFIAPEITTNSKNSTFYFFDNKIVT